MKTITTVTKKITYTTQRTIQPKSMSQQALLFGILTNIDLLDNTLHLEHIKILLLLHENGGTVEKTTAQIGNAIRVNNQNTRRYLNQLEEKGYIEYIPGNPQNIARLKARGRTFCRTIFQPQEYTSYSE